MLRKYENKMIWKLKVLSPFVILAIILTTLYSCTSTKPAVGKKVLVLQDQGSFAVGGSSKTNPGTFDPVKPTAAGQTYHGDHAFVSYQIPANPKKYPLIFLHGAGQSSKTWETTPDGRDGFQNIFLRKGFGVYLLDQPRRGKAGKSMVKTTVEPIADEQMWFAQFRIGNYPDYFSNVQFPKDPASLEQFFRQMTPNTGPYDADIISSSVSSLVDKIGESVLITHSQGCGPGWLTAVKNKNVKAIVAYEPWSGFVFPKGEVPPPVKSAGLFGELKGAEISKAEFDKLTKIPIIIYYGDNIADSPTNVWNKDHWRGGLAMARAWRDVVNKHGGDVQVIHLPEIGVFGNTHFAFADLNNVKIANLMSGFLKEKGLDK